MTSFYAVSALSAKCTCKCKGLASSPGPSRLRCNMKKGPGDEVEWIFKAAQCHVPRSNSKHVNLQTLLKSLLQNVYIPKQILT